MKTLGVGDSWSWSWNSGSHSCLISAGGAEGRALSKVDLASHHTPPVNPASPACQTVRLDCREDPLWASGLGSAGSIKSESGCPGPSQALFTATAGSSPVIGQSSMPCYSGRIRAGLLVFHVFNSLVLLACA